MTVITRENAPVLQSLFNSVAVDKPRVGCTVRVTSGKHKGKIGVVEKHILSQYEHAFRYGSDMSHMMTQARGRYGYAIKIKSGDSSFWVKADNVMVCYELTW